MPITDAKKSVGESIGSVTWRNCCQRPAPSTLAASYSSSGIVWSPARTITVNNPMFIHRVANDTEISAKFRREGLTHELASAGFELEHWWTDRAGDFSLSLSRVE